MLDDRRDHFLTIRWESGGNHYYSHPVICLFRDSPPSRRALCQVSLWGTIDPESPPDSHNRQ